MAVLVGAVAATLAGAGTLAVGLAPVGLVPIGLGGAAPAAASGATGSWSTMFVANLGSHSLTPIDLATGAPAPSIGLGELPDALAVAPGAKTVYVVEVGSDGEGSPGRVVPLATNNYTLGKAIAVGTDPQAIAIAPDGRMAYVLNGYDAATTPATVPVTITPVDLVTRAALPPVAVGTLPLSMTMSPNGKLIYVVDSSVSHQGEPSGITPFYTSTGKAGPEIKLPQAAYPPFPVSGLVFAPDSATAYAITPSGVVPVDTATGRPGKVIGLRTSMPVALAVSANGSTLAEVGTPITALEQGSPYANNVTVAFLSTATGAVRKVAPLGDEPGAVSWQVAMAPDGSTAYVLTIAQSPSLSSLVPSQSTLVRVDVATGKEGKAIDVGQSAQALAFGPGGTTLYVLVIGPYRSGSPHDGGPRPARGRRHRPTRPGRARGRAAPGLRRRPARAGPRPGRRGDPQRQEPAGGGVRGRLAPEGGPGGRDRARVALLRLRPDHAHLLGRGGLLGGQGRPSGHDAGRRRLRRVLSGRPWRVEVPRVGAADLLPRTVRRPAGRPRPVGRGAHGRRLLPGISVPRLWAGPWPWWR